jgi:hypothetical protein
MYNCECCKNIVKEGDELTVISENRLYFFCCTKCRNKWVSVLGLDRQLRLF